MPGHLTGTVGILEQTVKKPKDFGFAKIKML
jgi:hypothetical protein